MTDEKKIAPDSDKIENTANAVDAPSPKKKGKKKWAIIGGVVGVIVVAAVGLWVWHSDPGFCNNPVCHDSMDPYVQTYYSEDNAPATDKWGNEVTNSHAMLVVSHAAEGKACLDCHIPDLGQQLGEVGGTITGNYYLPLEEVDVLSLRTNANLGSDSGRGDEFCMNDSCHGDLTRQELTQRTANLSFNPHAWQREQNQCSDCHKSHRASTVMCTECHAEAKAILPDGWVDSAKAKAIEQAIYA